MKAKGLYVWDPVKRFYAYAMPEPMSGCWLWTGNGNERYGTLKVHGKPTMAHRYSWALHYGPIPDGLNVCHKCDVTFCVNPAHLFLGTQADNHADMVAKGRRASFAGVKNGRAKLTPPQVEAIRNDPRTYSKISVEYGVSSGMVGHIKRGLSWNG